MAKTKAPAAMAGQMATAAPYQPSPADMKREQDYQATSDVRALHTAHKIKQDAPRHARAKDKMKQHMAALKALMTNKRKPDTENAADAAGPDSELPSY